MEPIYQASLPLPPYEIDFTNRLRLSAFFRMVQDVASVHATRLGLGYDALSKFGLFWVLSWARIDIDRYPGLGETIVITTWTKMRHRMFSIRDLLFEDGQGRPWAGCPPPAPCKVADYLLPLGGQVRRQPGDPAKCFQ